MNVACLVFWVLTAEATKLSWVANSAQDPSSWGDPQNWSPAQVPGPDDDVVVANAAAQPRAALAPVRVKSLTLSQQSTLTITSVALTASALFVNDTSTLQFEGGTAVGNVTAAFISSKLSFESGSLSGNWTITKTGVVEFPDPEGMKAWVLASVLNFGTLDIGRAYISLQNNSQILNYGLVQLSGGSHLQGDASSHFESVGNCVAQGAGNPVLLDAHSQIAPLQLKGAVTVKYTAPGTVTNVSLEPGTVLLVASAGVSIHNAWGTQAILAFNDSGMLTGDIQIDRLEVALPGDAAVKVATNIVCNTTAIYSGGLDLSPSWLLSSGLVVVDSSRLVIQGGIVNTTHFSSNSDSAELTNVLIHAPQSFTVWGRSSSWILVNTTINIPAQGHFSAEAPLTLTGQSNNAVLQVDGQVTVSFPVINKESVLQINQMSILGNATYDIVNGTLAFGVATFSCAFINLLSAASVVQGDVATVNWSWVAAPQDLILTVQSFHISCGKQCGGLSSQGPASFAVEWAPTPPAPPTPPSPPPRPHTVTPTPVAPVPRPAPAPVPVPAPAPTPSPNPPPSPPNIILIIAPAAGSFVVGLLLGAVLARIVVRRSSFKPLN